MFTDGHFGAVDADIDAPEAWTITQGNNNIIIAVLDQGLTPDHPDLPNARQVRLNGSNFGNGDSNNPSPTGNENHGNACAGIIAATQNNNEGITGIAPNCRIMPVRTSGALPERMAAAIDFARQNGAHIISCSWGYNSQNPNFYPVIKDAIIAAATQGRNGLGCVVVFAAGNWANRVVGNNGYISFPANVNVAGVLTVGATDRVDLQANYSPTSNPSSPNNQIIDMVAPSHRAYSWQIAGETWECWSIDIPDTAGYNPVKATDGGPLPVIDSVLPAVGVNHLSYTGRFGGTSYSCPQVAGVAALMLSINPNLTQQQVFNILTATADRVGGYVYTNGRSNELGFGRLNACRAVTQVISTISTISGSTSVCTAGATFTVNNLPTGCTINWTFSSNLQSYDGGSNFIALRAIGSGIGWVNATINSVCGQVVLPQKDVWLGFPSTPTGISGFCCNGMEFGSESMYNFTANHAANQGVCQYEWVVAGGSVIEGQGTEQITVLTWNATPEIPIYFDVSVRVGNLCGWGQWLWRTGYVVSGIGPMYTVFPNPFSTQITITQAKNLNVAFNSTNPPKPIRTLRLIDKMGFTIITWSYNGNQTSVTLNVLHIQKGLYLLRINESESHTIMKL